MNRSRILHEAKSLFAKEGINAVNMRRIAIEADVNEDDIYTEFEGIGQLLEISLHGEIERIENIISKIKSISDSAFETLVIVMCLSLKEVSGFCPAFYKEIKHYPSSCKYLTNYRLKFLDDCTTYFRQCIEEGYFKSIENPERMASFYIEEIGNLASKYQFSMIQMLMTDLCTLKGFGEMQRIMTVLATKKEQIIK